MSYRIAIVDDEPDIHALTKMSLKRMEYNGEKLDLVYFESGKACLEDMREHPDTALILMDVVMENDSAGLDTVKAIREELGNEMVRIILRTGQPGSAPERKVIDNYDLDGYLSKSELTQTRLYTAVRTSLKSYSELKLLQQHRDSLTYLNEALLSLHAAQNQSDCLKELTQIVSALAGSELTVLYLLSTETEDAQPHIYFHGPEDSDDEELRKSTLEILEKVKERPRMLQEEAQTFEEGWLTPVMVPNGKGYGLIYVRIQEPDSLQLLILDMLSAHAAVALSLVPEHADETEEVKEATESQT